MRPGCSHAFLRRSPRSPRSMRQSSPSAGWPGQWSRMYGNRQHHAGWVSSNLSGHPARTDFSAGTGVLLPLTSGGVCASPRSCGGGTQPRRGRAPRRQPRSGRADRDVRDRVSPDNPGDGRAPACAAARPRVSTAHRSARTPTQLNMVSAGAPSAWDAAWPSCDTCGLKQDGQVLDLLGPSRRAAVAARDAPRHSLPGLRVRAGSRARRERT